MAAVYCSTTTHARGPRRSVSGSVHLGVAPPSPNSTHHSGGGTDTLARRHTRLEETVDTTDRELQHDSHKMRFRGCRPPAAVGPPLVLPTSPLPAGRHETNATGGPSCRSRPCHPFRPCPCHPCQLRTAERGKTHLVSPPAISPSERTSGPRGLPFLVCWLEEESYLQQQQAGTTRDSQLRTPHTSTQGVPIPAQTQDLSARRTLSVYHPPKHGTFQTPPSRAALPHALNQPTRPSPHPRRGQIGSELRQTTLRRPAPTTHMSLDPIRKHIGQARGLDRAHRRRRRGESRRTRTPRRTASTLHYFEQQPLQTYHASYRTTFPSSRVETT